MSRTELPVGTVTFLFSDIQGSTKLLQALGDRYRDLHARHATLIREAIAGEGGIEVSTEGDSFFVAFRSAIEAVRAATAAQLAIAAETWPEGASVRVRMGMHIGEGTRGGDNYIGIDGRLGGMRVVVDMRFPLVFLLHVSVRDVHVIQSGVVVLVGVRGQHVGPVLSPMEVMRHVIVLVPVLQGLVLMMTLLPCHPVSPPHRPGARSTSRRYTPRPTRCPTPHHRDQRGDEAP